MKYYTNVLEYLENSSKDYPDKKAFIDEKNAISFKELEMFSKSLGCAISDKTDSAIKRPIVVLVDNNVLEISQIVVNDKEIPNAFDNVKILHISDLHNKKYGKNNEITWRGER